MRIAVFGSTGGVGQHVVRAASEQGHKVVAFLRTPDKLQYRDGVHIVQGDAFDAVAVAGAIRDTDAVISCLSSSAPMKKSTELQRMTQNIVDGMQLAGVQRVAYCASAGVDGELEGVVGKSVMWMLRHALADHRTALEHVRAADLDFTVARPTSLSHAAFDPEYLESFTGVPGNVPIPRASVAHFLVKALEHPELYSRTSVGLSLKRRAQR